MSQKWDSGVIREFRPTHVIDAAFLTPKYVEQIGETNFINTNRLLISRVEWLGTLESVKSILTISSGAATLEERGVPQQKSKQLYGQLKLEAEDKFISSAHLAGHHLTIARAWSLSGAFALKKTEYALNSILAQAHEGQVFIDSPGKVWRKYTAITDLLSVGLAAASVPSLNIGGISRFETGGELIEIRDLAVRVANAVNPGAKIVSNDSPTAVDSLYFSDDSSWETMCNTLRLIPQSLDQQIRVAHDEFNSLV